MKPLQDEFISTLLAYQPKEKTYRIFDRTTYDSLYKIVRDIIKTDVFLLYIPDHQLHQPVNYLLLKAFLKKPIVAEKRYRCQTASGGSYYAYVKLEIAPTHNTEISILENLPPTFEVYRNTMTSKKSCWQLITVLPYITKAIIDFCKEHQLSGLEFTLLEVKFHLMDFKEWQYYNCTILCLRGVFKKWLKES